MKDDVGVDDKPVTELGIKAGVLRVSSRRQDRLESRKISTQMALFEATRNVISNISLPQDCWSDPDWRNRIGLGSQLRTLPLAVFFRNFVCDTGKSAGDRLRIVIGG